MWTASRAPTRPSRTGSVHSVASISRPTSAIASSSPAPPPLSRQSSRNTGYESDQSSDTAAEEDYGNYPQKLGAPRNANAMPPMWNHQRQESGSAVSRLSQRFATKGAPVTVMPLRTQQPLRDDIELDDDSHSRTSTLNGDERDYEFPEKTPTPLTKRTVLPMGSNPDIPYYTLKSPPLSNPNIPYFTLESPPLLPQRSSVHIDKLTLDSPAQASKPTTHVPGPLESQLAALMSKLVFMEQKNPVVSVTPEDYAEMSSRLKTLEAEKKSLQKRHEAIWALRDEDLENNIKIRGQLAKARRELEAMTKLRDEDLVNVQAVRIKLAESTRQVDQLQAQSGRSSPSRRNRASTFLERRDTTDLFAVAKAAALQERALELEKRNSDLQSQISTLKGGASIDDLNSMTAHQAWKDKVHDLEAKLKTKDAEVARLRSGNASAAAAPAPSGSVEWHRVEAIHEEHAGYREKMGAKLQALRSEKEGLQRELHRKEDECHGLEVKVQSLQRRVR